MGCHSDLFATLQRILTPTFSHVVHQTVCRPCLLLGLVRSNLHHRYHCRRWRLGLSWPFGPLRPPFSVVWPLEPDLPAADHLDAGPTENPMDVPIDAMVVPWMMKLTKRPNSC